jgi:hypothetical protein
LSLAQNWKPLQLLGEATFKRNGTFSNVRQNGRPWSLEKDQNMRELDANIPTVAHTAREVTIAAMAALPPTELVAWRNISIKGYPVLVERAFSKLPMLNRRATTMANPVVPFRRMLSIIDRGTTRDGL